ncbi:MAG TPA: hypothetical protein VJ755_12540 [Gemmatimonadales bacterium]|nr:hypothetical protein [Gemmatimonadales bacterium]
MGSIGIVAAIALVIQQAASPPDTTRDALRAGLDTLYGGYFARAAAYFEAMGQRDTADPAPLIFQAGAYIWWGSALDSAAYEMARIDSLLALAMSRARSRAGTGDFWLATALGYRARQREENGHGFSAAKDAKAMRDIYGRLLAADSSCFDCYLGLGVYDYGLARAGAVARFFAKLIGLGSGNAERGIRYMRRAAHDGDLARVESTWVLAAALMREAARDHAGRAVLEREARGYVETLAARYPQNAVFQRFLKETAAPSAGEAIRPATRASPAAVALAPIGGRQRRELTQHVVHVALHGIGCDVEPLRDLLVAEPRRDQLPNLVLALGESHGCAAARSGYRRAGATPTIGNARWGGRRWQIGTARHRPDGLRDVLRGRVLHDEPIGAAFDELLDVLLRRHEIDDDRFRVGRRRFEVAQECLAFAIGEGRVEQHDLWSRIAQRRAGGRGVLGAGDDFNVGKRRQQAREPVTHQPIVLHDEHANSSSGRERGSHAAFSTTAVHAVAFHHPIIDSASAWRRHPALDAANGPRHTPPFLARNVFTAK